MADDDYETEIECKARGGTPVPNPASGKYMACYPPKIKNPLTDVIEREKRKTRDRQILVVAGLVFLALVYFDP